MKKATLEHLEMDLDEKVKSLEALNAEKATLELLMENVDKRIADMGEESREMLSDCF